MWTSISFYIKVLNYTFVFQKILLSVLPPVNLISVNILNIYHTVCIISLNLICNILMVLSIVQSFYCTVTLNLFSMQYFMPIGLLFYPPGHFSVWDLNPHQPFWLLQNSIRFKRHNLPHTKPRWISLISPCYPIALTSYPSQ